MLTEYRVMTIPGLTHGSLPVTRTTGGVSVFPYPTAYEQVVPASWTTQVAIVFDVLRATSTMAAILSHPGNRIIPCFSVEEARGWKAREPSWLLAGERGGIPPEGFERGNSPREWGRGPERVTVIQTTTNGTRALKCCAGAAAVVAAALVNGAAVAAHLHRHFPGWPLALVLAGTGEDFALEDAVGAAWLLKHLDIDHPWRSLAPRDAEHAFHLLAESRNGRRLVELGLGEDLAWCSQLDALDVVPLMKDGVLLPDKA